MEDTMAPEQLMEKLVSLAKRRGFIFQGSDIYGGLAGTWDYGPVGVLLKNNIKNLWWKLFVEARSDIYGVDAAVLMNPRVWEASGHTEGFTDPLVQDTKTGERFRLDHVLKDAGIDPSGMTIAEMQRLVDDRGVKSPKGNPLSKVRQFNLMFQTNIGAAEDSSSITYLRPETAGGIFVNFKNVVDSMHPALPFGIAQIGKAFRNEISPRDFIFRTREFEQMEVEWFCEKEEWKKHFDTWRETLWTWVRRIGIDEARTHELEVSEKELPHYSKKNTDFEFDFPFGRDELYGLAYRTDYDLSKQSEKSGVALTYFNQETGKHIIPHVIEPSLGVDRTIMALLTSAYTEEQVMSAKGEKETRVLMKFKPEIAPIKVAILPLMRKDELKTKAMEIYDTLKQNFVCEYDETGSIGKRYRRQDEIGTPYAVTIDFDTLKDDTATVRDRDSMKQERVSVAKLLEHLSKKLSS